MKKRNVVGRLFGLMFISGFGAGIFFGSVGVLGMQEHPVSSWFNSDPSKVVSDFLNLQSGGHFDDAKQLLSGEAQTMISNSHAVPEPVIIHRLEVGYQSEHLARITAHWSSKTEAMAQDIYLFRHSDGSWKIYSIQLHTNGWRQTFGDTDVPADAKAVINGYTHLLSSGDASHAVLLLSGPARIRSTDLSIPSGLPLQQIDVVDVHGVGITECGDVLAEVTEKVEHATVKLLYTLTRVQEGWRISDIRLMDREVESG